jgi:general secretion pathway protein H
MTHPRTGQRGMTLIEIMVALMIAAVLFSAVVVSIGSITGTKAKAATSELAGVIRSLYDSAALSGKTCRLVFEIADPKTDGRTSYRAECAAGNVTTSRDREVELREGNRSADELAKKGGDTRRDYRKDSEGKSLDELMGEERGRVEKASQFSEFTAPEIEPRKLPSDVKLSVWTRHQREPADKGVAYLYFFPQGFTERAQVYVRQGSNVWTLRIQPLTGRVEVVGEELEVPRS